MIDAVVRTLIFILITIYIAIVVKISIDFYNFKIKQDCLYLKERLIDLNQDYRDAVSTVLPGSRLLAMPPLYKEGVCE